MCPGISVISVIKTFLLKENEDQFKMAEATGPHLHNHCAAHWTYPHCILKLGQQTQHTTWSYHCSGCCCSSYWERRAQAGMAAQGTWNVLLCEQVGQSSLGTERWAAAWSSFESWPGHPAQPKNNLTLGTNRLSEMSLNYSLIFIVLWKPETLNQTSDLL